MLNHPLCINKEKYSMKKKKNMWTWYVRCQMQDRGSHQEPAYHDHEDGSEVAFPLWPPHQGYGPKGISNKRTLEQEVSSRAGLPTFRSFLVNGIMVNWSPSQHNGLHSDIITVLSIHTGSWFQGWKTTLPRLWTPVGSRVMLMVSKSPCLHQ